MPNIPPMPHDAAANQNDAGRPSAADVATIIGVVEIATRQAVQAARDAATAASTAAYAGALATAARDGTPAPPPRPKPNGRPLPAGDTGEFPACMFGAVRPPAPDAGRNGDSHE